MRIVIPKIARNTKVYADDGTDITDALCIKEITIRVDSGSSLTATLECYADQIELELEDGKWRTSKSRHREPGGEPMTLVVGDSAGAAIALENSDPHAFEAPRCGFTQDDTQPRFHPEIDFSREPTYGGTGPTRCSGNGARES